MKLANQSKDTVIRPILQFIKEQPFNKFVFVFVVRVLYVLIVSRANLNLPMNMSITIILYSLLFLNLSFPYYFYTCPFRVCISILLLLLRLLIIIYVLCMELLSLTVSAIQGPVLYTVYCIDHGITMIIKFKSLKQEVEEEELKRISCPLLFH